MAAATVAASGTSNVVDDDPVTRDELDTILAHVVGREKLPSQPNLLVGLMGDKL